MRPATLFWYTVLETVGERSNEMVRKFPSLRSERKKRSTSESTPQFPNGISGKLTDHLTSNRNFRIFWLNGEQPLNNLE